MKFNTACLVASLIMIACPAFAQDSLSVPRLIIVNAKIRTMDPVRPNAEALAIYGNRMGAIGSTEQVRALAAKETRVIDAHGKLVLPGFNDAHVHFLNGGFQLSNVELRDAATPEEFTGRIQKYARQIPRGRWITGGDWDHERWTGAPLPIRQWIDSVTPDNPVFVSRLDGHMALANGFALKLAGVTRETKDPAGGLIVRDPQTGEATGILKDAAMSFVYKVIPPQSNEEKLAAARAATAHAARLGITSVQDMSAGDDVGLYQELFQAGELKTRIYAISPLPWWERLGRVGVRAAFGSDMLRLGGLKGFSDGSLGSSTAFFFEPYKDAPDTLGLPGDEMFPEGAMLKRVLEADRAGLQVMVHAIGDRANDQMLTIYEDVTKSNGERDRRFRIEHAQHMAAKDFARFAVLDVIASVQPYHAIDDGSWAEKRIGVERGKRTYAFRTFMKSGVRLAFGTDWTVAPLDPMQTLYAAVTRATLDGKHPKGWNPEQKLNIGEAVYMYTMGSAYAEFQDKSKGSITPGKLADLVVLDTDIFAIKPEAIRSAKVVMTFLGGRLIFSRN